MLCYPHPRNLLHFFEKDDRYWTTIQELEVNSKDLLLYCACSVACWTIGSKARGTVVPRSLTLWKIQKEAVLVSRETWDKPCRLYSTCCHKCLLEAQIFARLSLTAYRRMVVKYIEVQNVRRCLFGLCVRLADPAWWRCIVGILAICEWNHTLQFEPETKITLKNESRLRRHPRLTGYL